MRLDPNAVVPEYFVRLLSSAYGKRYFLRAAKQTTGIASINKTQLSAFPVPLPPLPEQRRIADILDKADAIRRKRKEAIALTEELLRSTFLDMFGDPVTNPKGWHRSTVGIECRNNGGALQTGPFGSQLHASDYSDEGTPVVMPQDIVGGTISEKRIARVNRQHVERLGQHRLELGDVIFSRRGDVARFAVVGEQSVGWLCGTGCLRIRLGGAALTAAFLKGELAHPSTRRWLEQEAKGTTMLNLNTTILGALPLRMPPRDLQDRFSEFVSHHEAVLGKATAALASTDQVFSSLVGRAFSGPSERPC